ncbi:23S rRNA (guanosine(2251)-2'-O)-methyltransferase RlmB [bacterium]|jgi:23S rRNA (guanosine2251-2'-O)-methyltransferase|nr:23S rRNA (guanosine(2251)-2'-O)-methyltransferase RlmB [bacterium]MBT3903215.1 23S rRNA (guanosine(2251)-2'-O)-methyltransferase RlmB [bacterium]MBT4577969.1 23S rRNA (guanosine(2251)-2'-O)-methyltransferase RlmB [bacterium]MBT5346075.1 23S rRNA (guanosine(2251)-2'-O)-methyltransferase RlmB [bacterium]MBT6131425.1 23S rRNA (guanosine(2251)-2'-O)-methyltransferase RlmB [bacterium]
MAKARKTEKQLDYLYGVHPLIEMIKAKRRRLHTLYTTKPEPRAFAQVKKLLPPRVQMQYVERAVLTKMVGTSDHQGIVACVDPVSYRQKFFDPKKERFILFLDQIQDPRNLGAILRSAYCTGVQGVIVCEQKSASLSATASKSAAGLSEHLELFRVKNSAQAVRLLNDAGYTMYAAVFNGQDAATVAYKDPLCLVIGSEGHGVSRVIADHAQRVTIAQRTADISYNASVAAGILLFLIGTSKKFVK